MGPKQIRRTSRETAIRAAEIILPLLLLAVKLYFVNRDMLRTGVYTPAMTAFTLLLVSGICLIPCLMHKSPGVLFWTLYTFICCAATVDAVYAGYTGKLPSAEMLRYTGQLGAVKNAILDNITFHRILYILDIPLFLLWHVNFRPRILASEAQTAREAPGEVCPDVDMSSDEQESKQTDKRPKKPGRGSVFNLFACIMCVVFALSLLLCTGTCLFTPFRPSYFRAELLSYHVTDLVKQILPAEYTVPELASLSEKRTAAVSGEMSPYRGIAHGRNVITIQVEALQNFVIGMTYMGQEVTPNLNRLIGEDSLYFDNYYYQIGGGNTADAEFAVNNSLYAPDIVAAYSEYADVSYYSMAHLLKDNGYGTANAYHGYKKSYWNRDLAYPGQGFDAYLSGDDYFSAPEEVMGMGISDGEFFTRAVAHMKEQADAGKGPFYAFLVTLTSHYPFDMPADACQLTLDPADEGTLWGNYLQAVRYTDAAIGLLLDALKAAGLYDTSVITIYGDHFGLPVYNLEAKARLATLLGQAYTYVEHFNVPLIIHTPGSGITETCSVAGGHIDLMPTLLDVLGLRNAKGVMFGQNLLTAREGIVYQQTHLARGSFLSDTVLFRYPFTDIPFNTIVTGIPSGKALDPDAFWEISREAKAEIERCIYLLENDLILWEKHEKNEP